MIDRFNASEIDVLLLSAGCGKEGITLTHGNHLLMLDQDLTPHLEDQVKGRLHRLGQTRQVTVHRLFTDRSIEDFLIHNLLPQVG